MISIVGMNFPLDLFAMEHIGTNRTIIESINITGGIYDKMYITLDFDATYNPYYPLTWDLNTIMSCNFNGSINGGNIDYVLSQLDAIRIKRKLPEDFEWITIAEYPVTASQDFTILKYDNTNKNNTIYEYAMVPVISLADGTEGNYVTDSIMSCFNGIFICESEDVYKLYAGVNFGSAEQVNKTGVYEPLGRKYPIVVSNALTNYYKGSISGTVILDDDLYSGKINRGNEVTYRKAFLDFLTDKKAKIIKDYNGNIWLTIIVDSPSVSPNNNTNFGIADVGFNFVEIGDANNQEDLQNAGIINL